MNRRANNGAAEAEEATCGMHVSLFDFSLVLCRDTEGITAGTCDLPLSSGDGSSDGCAGHSANVDRKCLF